MPWDTPNADVAPIAPADVAPAPRLGFLQSIAASYDADFKTQSVNGLSYEFHKADEEQAVRVRKKGLTYTSISDRSYGVDGFTGENITLGPQAYTGIARNVMNNGNDVSMGHNPQYIDAMNEHDVQISELNKKDPSLNLRSTKDIFSEVQRRAKEAEELESQGHTIPGYLGSFLGGAVAGVDPRVNLPNFLTLGVGGVGKTALARIAVQAGGQGAVQGINELLGVGENRRLLGLEEGSSAGRIAAAAAGGATLQGVGEAVVAGFRRFKTGEWFDHMPNDPAPPRPPENVSVPTEPNALASVPDAANVVPSRDPFAGVDFDLSRTPQGRARAHADLNHVTSVLEKWDAPRPFELPAPTDTRIPNLDNSRFDMRGGADLPRGTESVDAIARRVDPDTFNAYDKLAQRKAELRLEIGDTTASAAAEADRAVIDIDKQIADLETKSETANKKNAKKYAVRIDDLQAQREAKVQEIVTSQGTEPANARRLELLNIEHAMWDMRPQVQRAYDRARSKWTTYQADAPAVEQMIKDGSRTITERPYTSPLSEEPPPEAFASKDISHFVPETKLGTPVPGEDAIQAVERVRAETQTVRDEAQGAFVAASKHFTSEEGKALKTYQVMVDGKPVDVELDGFKFKHINEDGSTELLTPRQLLEKVQEDQGVLEAITSCSLNATSLPVSKGS